MRNMYIWILLSGAAFAQLAALNSSSGGLNPSPNVVKDESAPAVEGAPMILPDLLAMPNGKATVIGGSVRQVDRVRDQLILSVYGGHTIKVLFDGRTQIYRDGVKTSLADLRDGDQISVETVLDGTAVFVRSIHMLSRLPEGQSQGQILNYDRGRGEIVLRDPLSPQSFKLRVTSNTQIVREGQESSSSADLTVGSLVAVTFQPERGENVASKISLLATPGTSFTFTGTVTFLNLRSGTLAVLDPRDNKRYEISLDPSRLNISRDLREGSDVTVNAEFDGNRYSARSLTVNSNTPQVTR